MDEYWVDINGDNESFWGHEWSKHGTCINTISPDCYEGYTAQEEVGDFFEKVVDLFKGLDTYKVWDGFLSCLWAGFDVFVGSCGGGHHTEHVRDLYSQRDPGGAYGVAWRVGVSWLLEGEVESGMVFL